VDAVKIREKVSSSSSSSSSLPLSRLRVRDNRRLPPRLSAQPPAEENDDRLAFAFVAAATGGVELNSHLALSSDTDTTTDGE